MDSDAAGAQFDAVQHEVVAFGANFPWRRLELFQIFIDDAGEGVLGADPGLVIFVPFKERETGEPEKFPLGFVDDTQGFAKLQAQLSREQRGGFRAFDFLFRGNGHHQVAGFCAASVGQLLDVVRAEQLFHRGSRAFRRQLDEVNSARANALPFLRKLIELLS